MTIDRASVDPVVSSEPSDVRKAAEGLEAWFLRRVLAEVRGTQEAGLLDGGLAGGMFRDMLDEALADSMTAAGGMGLADVVAADLERKIDPP